MSGHARQALLQRFATDLYVVTAKEESVRPADMPCCWVYYDKPWHPVPGRTTEVALPICTHPCKHNHHRHELLLAPTEG